MYQNLEYKNRFRILKGGLISLVVASNLYGAPMGGTVTSGTANISQNGNTTNINQSSNKATINWQDFSIKSNETVNFNQPNKNSITLNRVVGNEKSVIDGALNANGQVWILNSNGTLFGKNAKINTSGLLVTTKELSDEDFNKGNYNFKGDSKASIENFGDINLNDKAYAVFLANSVINNGTIKVYKGNIHLVGASDVTLTLDDNSNISLKVNKGVLDALVENNNLIVSNGGNVYLTTNAKNELLKGVVNNKGIIEVNSLDDLQSEVIVYAHGGTANIDGQIKAKGSFVETSGEKLSVKESFKIEAKTWLLDPTNIIIESTGGNSLSGESVSATAVQNALANTNVELQATNNITVNQNITWSEATQLKLSADNINVDATINNTNSTDGGVYFNASNNHDKVVFGTNGKVVVNNINQLQWINTALNGKYELGSNIDASVTSSWNSGAGFNPIGNSSTNFTGTFDGKNYTISNLTINRPSISNIGVFSKISESSIIQNIGLDNVNIKGNNGSGGLVGENYGTIKNSYVKGIVDFTGGSYVGGFVGGNRGTIENSYFEGTVVGAGRTGGFVGWNDSAGVIRNSYFKGTVTGTGFVGGFASSGAGTIENSYASGTVNGIARFGGLFGQDNGFTIINSWYDNETNSSASMEDSGYGKTKAEIVSLLNGSEWTTDSSKGRGYGTDATTTLPFLKNVTKLSNTLFEDGFGTSTNPYTITNWTQLQNINNSNILTKGYYLSLVNNLDSSTSDYTSLASPIANMGFGWNSIGNNSATRFKGTFDGLGYTISGLYINRHADNIGLFGVTDSNTLIKNLGLEDINITGNFYVGGLVGYNYGTISNSYALGFVTGSEAIGGLIGVNDSGMITNSYASGEQNGSFTVGGGLVGSNYGGTILNSYATGSVRSGLGNYLGGLVGYNSGIIQNSYASGVVSETGSNNIGGLVGINHGTISNSYYDNEINTGNMVDDSSYGKTKVEIGALATANWDNTIWAIGGRNSIEGFQISTTLPYLLGVTRQDDQITPQYIILFNSGYGTSENPYTITNWTQLQNINNSNIITQSYYFNLLNNLSSSTSDYTNFASSTANSNQGWNPLGNNSSTRFKGIFDGLGNTISDLYINRSANGIGLFGFTDTGSIIKNLGLENVDISGSNYVGGLVGSNRGTIKNSYTSGSVSGNGRIGGLAGMNYNNAIVQNSYSLANVAGAEKTGGLVGYNYFSSKIENSYFAGIVIGSSAISDVGGLVGVNESSTITNSFYDSTKNSNYNNGLGTGKTTQEMSYGGTFKNIGWDIRVDNSVTSLTPILKYDSPTKTIYWAISPITLNYNLGSKSTTYDGQTQNLSNFYTTNPITIPTGYEFLNVNYKFQKNGNDVLGYKNAGTYSDIKVALTGNDEFLTIANSGNTDGTLTINDKVILTQPNKVNYPQDIVNSIEKSVKIPNLNQSNKNNLIPIEVIEDGISMPNNTVLSLTELQNVGN